MQRVSKYIVAGCGFVHEPLAPIATSENTYGCLPSVVPQDPMSQGAQKMLKNVGYKLSDSHG